MLLVLSGEGGSDIGGSSNGSATCDSDWFRAGPMALLIDREIHRLMGFSPIACSCIHWVGRTALAAKAKLGRWSPSVGLPSARRGKEMLAQYRLAQALGRYALEIEAQFNDTSVAVLFHDSDGTNADVAARWNHVVNALMLGFRDCDYERGVPMVPKPKQEAWFLCALKEVAYMDCAALEHESGNDSSPASLKKQLELALGFSPTSEDLVGMIEDRRVDFERVEMPSLDAFKAALLVATASL